ncbi:MAG TPA: VWA domain-containing protein [Bryobacteraceae bacterium]|nr:VWA domain-containing protein [Bryobacteraceae bacterium]
MFFADHQLSRRRLLFSGVSLALAGRSLRAQKDTTFTADVRVVNVFATVRDKHGAIVRNLTKGDFQLEEDGRPQVIRYFTQESDLPLTLGLLVDTSLSQRRVLGQERTASYRFIDRVLREDKDQTFVIHFDREVELLQDLTSSRKKLDAALAQLELPESQRPSWGGGRGQGRRPGGHGGGGTSLHDSVLLASDELMKKQTGRKALIVLSDGVDNGSKVPLTSAIESAQRADTLVYSILFADQEAYPAWAGGGGRMGRRGGGGYPGGRRPENRVDGKKVLQRLSLETGGGFFEVSKKQNIDKIYDQIQEELRNQYSLGYTPDRADAGAGYRKIRLMAKQSGLIVQTRDGYYAS